ncbi:hypothetical protein [Acetobacter thailandicus]|uniref:hypothetical protein n=1 Tax=Acetobacter thailandicus TaxID=1502842 RepID=UPI001BAB5818|nr:hypothetical protein [Acetobacter thailandicus]MBS0961398.1 hypothetical protein [Acetobacter thailandicus]
MKMTTLEIIHDNRSTPKKVTQAREPSLQQSQKLTSAFTKARESNAEISIPRQVPALSLHVFCCS